MRPLEPDGLRRAMGIDAEQFDALDLSSWGAFTQSAKASAIHASAFTRALAWGLFTARLLRWACLAARLEEVATDGMAPSKALVAAELWVRNGDERDRYEAYAAAKREDFATAGALTAVAAFLCGPSIAPMDAKKEPPPPRAGRTCTLNALVVAAASPTFGNDGFDHVNLIGLDLAFGGDGRGGASRALASLRGDAGTAG